MNIPKFNTAGIKAKAAQYKDGIKNTYANTVKPFVKGNYNKFKNLTTDTVDFVKKNPKKAGKYAAMGALATTAAVLVVKGIKDIIRTKKQNKILANFVVMQKAQMEDLKGFISVQNETIAGKDDVIEAQKKVIGNLKQDIAAANS